MLQKIKKKLRNILNRARAAQNERAWGLMTRKGSPMLHALEGGEKIWLYPDSKLSQSILCGNFEGTECTFLRRFLRSGDVFVDIGANIGLHTIIASSCVGPKGHIYAFEPSEQTFSRLKSNIATNEFLERNCNAHCPFGTNVGPYR